MSDSKSFRAWGFGLAGLRVAKGVCGDFGGCVGFGGLKVLAGVDGYFGSVRSLWL